MKRNWFLLVFVLALSSLALAQGRWRRIDLGSTNLTLNGIDPTFGPFGEIHTQYNGVPGDYAFYDPAAGMQIVAPSGQVAAVSAQAIAGSYTSSSGFDIEGFQWWPKSNQFFAFQSGATATQVTGQLADGTVEGWYDDFHFNDVSFIATEAELDEGRFCYDLTEATEESAALDALHRNRDGRLEATA